MSSEPIHVLASNWPKPKLTDENITDIIDAAEKLPKSPESQIYDEIQNNPDIVKENVERVGYTRPAVVSYDAAEESAKASIIHEEKSEEKDIGEMSEEEFEEYVNSFEAEELDFEITSQDVSNHPDTMVGDFDLSEMATLELVKVLNKYKETKESVTFKEMPEEVQEHILQYTVNVMNISRNDHSAKANQIRNALADTIIREYYKLIEIDKYTEEYGNRVDNLSGDMMNEMSPAFKEYNKEHLAHLQKLSETVDDPEKKQAGAHILEAIDDAFVLTRLVEAARRTRIKKFDVEKPKRVFDSFHTKFAHPEHNVYNLYGVTMALAKQLYLNQIFTSTEEARDAAVKVVLLFCDVCKNYNPENVQQYNFMYYFTYNLSLFNIYQGEDLEEYTKLFLPNIKKVYDAIESKNK